MRVIRLSVLTLATLIVAGPVLAQDSNITMPVGELERMLANDPMRIVSADKSRPKAPGDITSKADVSFGGREPFRVKLRRSEPGADGFNNVPRYDLAAYAIQQMLMDPSKAGENAPEKFKTKFVTPKGEFVVEVTRAWAPIAADRFYNLVKIGYYNEAAFYRNDGAQAEFGVNSKPEVSAVWMSMKLKDDPNKQSNDRGTVVFPRPYPNSRWAPVVINTKDNKDLNQVGYAPFGKVTQGMNVVDAIAKIGGEATPGTKAPDMDKLVHGGNAFLKANFPQMDFITSVTLVQ